MFTLYQVVPQDVERVLCLCVPVGQNFEPIETPFGLWTSVGPGNYVLDGVWTISIGELATLGLLPIEMY